MILISPDVLTRLNRLSAKDTKRALEFVDKFQKNPANPGISLERLTGVTDQNLWSGRVTQDLRAILHQGDTWTILYIDHHDDAYHWAERRKILRNPATGALQIVETTEEVEAIITQRSQICREARELLESGKVDSPFGAIVVDEVQDLKSQELRFLAALAAKTGSLMLAGDGGQRIYAKGSSLSSLGINVRGRSKVLRINYRTTAEIRRFADRVLGKDTDDLDGGAESRSGTRDILKEPVPVHRSNRSAAEQADFVARAITDRLKDGLKPEDVAVFARVRKSLDVVKRALASAAIPSRFLTNENESGDTSGVTLATMHRAKGLEFKTVFVIDASEEMLPLPSAFQADR